MSKDSKNKRDDELKGQWLVFGVMTCGALFLGGLAWYCYANPVVRLEHFSYLFTIVGSLATAATLYWLVVERVQLQEEKQAAERSRQARTISVWLENRYFPNIKSQRQITVIRNNSETPIYNAVVSIIDSRDIEASGLETPEEFRQVIDVIPPGESYTFTPQGYSGMGFHAGVEIAFDDSDGHSWARRGNGKLELLKERSFVTYTIELPPSFERLHTDK